MDRTVNGHEKKNTPRITALAGGVGGAKLAHGLARVLPEANLTVIVNTGDDFTHLGLRICPDVDTVCYTLAGLANPVTGWGRVDESWAVMGQIKRLGGPDWFNLGDQDLATHLIRTQRLAEGMPLSDVTQEFCAAWGVRQPVLPMTDDSMATWVETEEDGWLPFQEYFVHRLCKPVVKGFRFEGCETARPGPGVVDAIEQADWVVVCPSNPWVSISPILEVPGLADVLKQKKMVAVSPIIGGQAIKGPAAKMFSELGIQPSAYAVAEFYQGWLKGFVFDTVDQDQVDTIAQLGMETLVTDTIMKSINDRERLANEILAFLERLDGR